MDLIFLQLKNKTNSKILNSLNNNSNNNTNSNNNGNSLVNSGLNSDHPPQTPLTKIKVSPATQPIKKDKIQNTSKTTVNRELQKLTSLKG